MRICILKIAILIWSTCLSQLSFSQYYHKGDYVVTLKNDTIFGTIRRAFVGNTFNIKKADSEYVYPPNEIDAYYQGEKNILYKRRKLPGRTMQFIPCAEVGKINLYQIYYHTPVPGPSGMPMGSIDVLADVYLEKEQGVLVRVVKTKRFGNPKIEKDLFISMIEDVPGIKEQYITDDSNNIFDIRLYIHEYNAKAARMKN